MAQYVEMIRAFLNREDEGQGMVEYALIITLVALVAAVGLGVLGGNIDALLSGISF